MIINKILTLFLENPVLGRFFKNNDQDLVDTHKDSLNLLRS